MAPPLPYIKGGETTWNCTRRRGGSTSGPSGIWATRLHSLSAAGAPESRMERWTPASRTNFLLLDGLPRSGHVSDPTARIAVQELSGAIPPHAAELHRQIEEKEDSLEDIKLEIREIDSWLEWLPERERWVVTEHLIEGNPWRTVIYKYKLTFGEEYSKDTLARLQRAALARS